MNRVKKIGTVLLMAALSLPQFLSFDVKGDQHMRKHEPFKSLISLVVMALLLCISLPITAWAESTNEPVNETVQVDVSNEPIVDVYLAKGISDLETKSFKEDLFSQLNDDGYNTGNILVNEIQSAEINVSTAFNWQKDVSSSIGNISITGNGQNVVMNGNTSNAGKNAIWTFPTNDYHQKFTFGYNIDFGDSFNAGGMLLKVKRNGNSLTGYMISCNNSSWVSAAGGANGAIWTFSYSIGANDTNITKTLVKSLTIDQSGELTVEVGKDSIAVSGGGLSGTEVITTEDGYGNGFGFFSDHYSHNCERIGQFSLTNINLTQTNVKTLSDVLKTPEWRDNSTKMLVNVNDYSESDFKNSNDLSQTLMRTINENIHYISWGNSANQASNEDYIAKNNGNGMFINNSNYMNAIIQTAAYIESVINSYQPKQYVVVEEPIKLQVNPSNLKSNTATPNYPNGRWKIAHDYTYFAYNMGKYSGSDVYQKDMPSTFNKIGKYKIYFADALVKEVFVHRKPLASFSIMIGTDNAVTYYTNSYDMDTTSNIGFGPGIAEEEWSYRESTTTTWTEGKLAIFDPSKVYQIQLRVKDEQGLWSDPMVKYLSSSSNMPVADFNFGANVITIHDALQIINNSYDPSGEALTSVQWTLKKDNSIVSTESEPTTDFDAHGLGVGTYTYTLTVANMSGAKSDEFTRMFQVIDYVDSIPPTIDSVEFTDNLSVVTIRMSDETYGEGVKGVYINGEFYAGNPVIREVLEDTAVMRLQAEDNAGNKSEIRREHVPGRKSVTIETVAFSDDNKMATIAAATNEIGTSITGIYCNDELIVGNPVTYTIPVDNSQYLKVQAVNNEGDRSEIVTKRVPGWSEVVDTIAVTSVEFLNGNRLARVRADTTRLNASILGIYVNGVFHEGNPIECEVASGTEYLECQAADDVGDLSQPVVRQVPRNTGSGGGGHHSSGGSGSTTSISISEPVLQDDGQYRIGISAKDSECEIEKIVAVWDGHKENITKSHFILLENDTLLQVIAVNSDDRMTYKKVRIQLSGDEPIEEEPVSEIPAAEKTNPTAKQDFYAGQVTPAKENSADSESGSTADPREQLEGLLRRQQLKHKEQPAQAANVQQVIPETIRRSSAGSNRPGAAAVVASLLCFLALMVMIVLLVRRQHKQSAYCLPNIPKK
ncbi:hypothetical protein [Marasmitruncus massiliensis]|uniref:hypothetical protein n=1 Tax=Marasmitruncus massiliensis TaxID=1944642 RepID=UPI0011AECEF6|nr:hypothetical protein [Marasmitruncus massiliensis]